jgi:DNA polymerase III subunit beta
MKITSLQENLKNGLTAVAHIAGKNVNLPILNNILVSATDGNICLTSTDLEIGIVAKIRGKVETEGSYTVDGKVLADFVGLLPNQKVDIELKENALHLKSQNYKTSIRGQNAEEFPLIPQVDRQDFIKIKADEFRQALQQVVFATSSNNARAELSGVFFRISGHDCTLAATDSYRLAEKKIKIKNSQETNEYKLIVPSKTLQEVIRILSNIKNEEAGEEGREITVYITDNQILFNIDSIELVSRLVEGQYPEYEQIIPTRFTSQVSCDKALLNRAVKAAAIFSKSGINDINLDFPQDQNKIVVSSTSSNVGDNISEVEAIVSGPDNGIVVNHRYLIDGLNNIDNPKIKLEIIDGATPCVLRPDKDESYLYVIMPIKQ